MIVEPLGPLVIRARGLADRAGGDPRTVLPEASELTSAARTRADQHALALGLVAMARARRALLEHGEAEALLGEAAALAQRYGLREVHGEALLWRAVVHHDRGRTAAASRDFDRAARLVGEDLVAELAVQRATLAHNAGRLDEAAASYRTALAARTASAEVRAKAGNNLGNLEYLRGDMAAAVRAHDLAAENAPAAGPRYVAFVTESRAWGAVQSGRLLEGMALFDEAERLWREVGLPLGELYTEYSDALVDLRLVPEALEQARYAMTELAEQHLDLMRAEAQLRVAQLRGLDGDVEMSSAEAESAAAAFRRQRRSSWAARADLVAVQARLDLGTSTPRDAARASRAARTLAAAGIRGAAVEAYVVAGRVAHAAGRTRAAVEHWARAAELGAGGTVLGRLRSALAQALSAQVRGDDGELLRTCRSGLDDLARHRAALASTELRALASGHGAELGALGLAAHVRSGTPARVLDWMERTRAAALTSVAGTRGRGTDDGLADDLAALRALRTEAAQGRRETGQVAPETYERLRTLEERVRRRSWTRSADGSDPRRVPPLADLRSALDGRALAAYDVLDGRLIAVVATGGRRSWLVELGPVAPVEREVDGLRVALRSISGAVSSVAGMMREVAADAVRRLRSLLVEPLGLPASVSGVVVVPVGELQRVPWSALLDPPVSVVPSAALWLASRQVAPAAGRPLLVAGPQAPGAVDEVQAIAAAYDDPVVLLPPDSTAAAVRDALGAASVAHLACHGAVRADNPTFSSLLLSDGQLTLHEVEGRAAPHRIVMSACDVGSSVTYPGNEVLGFVGTLLAAGTGGLVASPVPVLDQHVPPLMVALHARLDAGDALPEALRAARDVLDPDDPEAYAVRCSFTAYGAG